MDGVSPSHASRPPPRREGAAPTPCIFTLVRDIHGESIFRPARLPFPAVEAGARDATNQRGAALSCPLAGAPSVAMIMDSLSPRFSASELAGHLRALSSGLTRWRDFEKTSPRRPPSFLAEMITGQAPGVQKLAGHRVQELLDYYRSCAGGGLGAN